MSFGEQGNNTIQKKKEKEKKGHGTSSYLEEESGRGDVITALIRPVN